MLFNSPQFIYLYLPIVLGVDRGELPRGASDGRGPPAAHARRGWCRRSWPTSSCSATSSTRTSSSQRGHVSPGPTGISTAIALPLGISFFTFTQIAFLVDALPGEAREFRLIHYALFVTYFPHLIAGPVLHHREMMPQFADAANYSAARRELRGRAVDLHDRPRQEGADRRPRRDPRQRRVRTRRGEPGAHARPGSARWPTPSSSTSISPAIPTWRSACRGCSACKLPLNFDSPYKASSIVDFWRRWHMTLSRFLRDYLYIPLGGNAHGALRRYAT
jgi:alginate O-acetyltransferase complex protein AlgI